MSFRTLIALLAVLTVALGTAAGHAYAGAAGGAGDDQYVDGIGVDGVDEDDVAAVEAFLNTLSPAEIQMLDAIVNRQTSTVRDANGDGIVNEGDSLTFEVDPCVESLLSKIDFLVIKSGSTRIQLNIPPTRLACGSLEIEVGGEPRATSGSNAGFDADSEFTIDSVNGANAADFAAARAGDGVLPRTGGEFAWLAAGLLVLLGSGLALRRVTRPREAGSSDA